MVTSREPLESGGMIRARRWKRPPRGGGAVAGVLGLAFLLVASRGFARQGAVPAPSPAAQVSVSPPLAARVEQARKLVERVRGVPFRSSVASAWLPEKELPRVLEKQLGEDLPVPFPRWAASLSALGLIDPSPDLLRRVTNLYARQVVGFYDPRERRFYVVPERSAEAASPAGVPTSAATTSLLETALLAHELAHALQDQRLGLDARMRALRDSTDGLLALQCFLEGEATVVMADALLDGLPPEARASAEASGLKQSLASLSSLEAGAIEGAEGVPEYFVKEMIFPYAAGTAWIERLRGTRGWAALDESYAGRIPSTTSEILHPEGLPARLRLAEADVPRPSALPAGTRALYPDTLGEWVLRFLLERAGAGPSAATVAAAWQDDRILFFEPERAPGLPVGFVWRIRASSPAGAARIADSLVPLWSGRPSSARPEVTVRGDVVTVDRLLPHPAPPPAP